MTAVGNDSDFMLPTPTRSSSASANHLLKKLSNFAGFKPDCIPALETLFSNSRVVPRHRDIIPIGHDADEVYLLLDGWAARYSMMNNGERQICAFLLPGDVFPIHVGPIGKMDHAIMALTPCRIASVSAHVFEQELLHNPHLAQAFWWVSILEKSILRSWVVSLGHRRAYSRLAHLFCELAERLKMVGLSDGVTFALPLIQTDLADAEGLTPVHINRMLQQLRDNHLIEWRANRLTILNAGALKEIGEFDPAYLNPGRPSKAQSG
jgi:CRP-like cAMP-binding protein